MATVLVAVVLQCFDAMVQKKTFLKKSSHWFFGGFYWVLGFIWYFKFSYLNEQLGSLLVDLAHELSFYLDSPVFQVI